MTAVRATLTPSEINGLGDTPILLASGQPGKWYLPTMLQVRKLDGDAFTINIDAEIGAGHSDAGFYLSLYGAGILDQTTNTVKYRNAPDVRREGDNPQFYVGKDLVVTLGYGSGFFSGTGSNVEVTVHYKTVDA